MQPLAAGVTWFLEFVVLFLVQVLCFLTLPFQKATKRKKIHAFKSKMRMEQLEVTQNKRQNAWQQFQTSKGRAKKVNFYPFELAI